MGLVVDKERMEFCIYFNGSDIVYILRLSFSLSFIFWTVLGWDIM